MQVSAEHHVRQPDGSWLFRESGGPEASIDLKSIGCTLQLGSLHRKVKFGT
jgi:hypothetical protein